MSILVGRGNAIKFMYLGDQFTVDSSIKWTFYTDLSTKCMLDLVIPK